MQAFENFRCFILSKDSLLNLPDFALLCQACAYSPCVISHISVCNNTFVYIVPLLGIPFYALTRGLVETKLRVPLSEILSDVLFFVFDIFDIFFVKLL